MKATIEVPDDLYRQVKAKSALEGLAIREVTEVLYRAWLTQDSTAKATPSPEEWLEDWIRLGEEALRDAPPGPTASEILESDRNRLDPD